MSDLLSFDRQGEDVGILQENTLHEPTGTVNETTFTVISSDHANTSSNAHTSNAVEIVPSTFSAPDVDVIGNESSPPRQTHVSMDSQTRPLTRSIGSATRTSTRIEVGIGATLVGLYNVIPSTGYGRGRRQSIRLASVENVPVVNGPPPNTTSERQFPRRSGIGHDANTRGNVEARNNDNRLHNNVVD